MSPLASNQLALLRALARHGVEFVVVGGVAAQIHGWRGATADLDIAVAPGDDNVERLSLALRAVGAAEGAVGGFGTAFKTRYGRLEVVRKAHAIGDYDGWVSGAERHALDEELTVLVAAFPTSCVPREAAGREKDRAVLPQMRRDFADSESL